jgi:hypothetical protein
LFWLQNTGFASVLASRMTLSEVSVNSENNELTSIFELKVRPGISHISIICFCDLSYTTGKMLWIKMETFILAVTCCCSTSEGTRIFPLKLLRRTIVAQEYLARYTVFFLQDHWTCTVS